MAHDIILLQSLIVGDEQKVLASRKQFPQVLVTSIRGRRRRHGCKHDPVLGQLYKDDVKLIWRKPMGLAERRAPQYRPVFRQEGPRKVRRGMRP